MCGSLLWSANKDVKTTSRLNCVLALSFLAVIWAPASLYASPASLNLAAASAQYVSVPASASLTSRPVTFEAWVNPGIATCNTILSRGDGGNGATTDYILQVGYNGSTCGVMNIGFFGAGAWDSSASLIPLNTWTHVAVTYDGTNKMFYINGVLDKTAARVGSLYQSGSVMYLGRQGTACNCNFFQGQLAEVRVWSTVRTASQISADMNPSFTGPQPGLVAYYHLNEGNGTTANDASGNGHTGTLMNSAGWANTAPPALGTASVLEGPATGTDTVQLTDPVAWTATANVSWLYLSPANQSGAGSANVVFAFDTNTGAARTGTLTIAGQTLTVTQAGSNYVAAPGVTTLVSLGLNFPQGIAVDGAGNVYIADTDNHMIEEWVAASNSVITLVSSGLWYPSGVAVDGAGNVYIADTGNDAVKEWVAASHAVITLDSSSGFNGPEGVAVDGAGNVYFVNDYEIKEWVAASQTINTLVYAGPYHPRAVAVDGAGNVYFTDAYDFDYSDPGYSTIEEWMAASHTVNVLVPSVLNRPQGVAVDGAGNVYIADTYNHATKKWVAANHTVIPQVSSGTNYPVGVAVDGAGNLYIVDSYSSAIKELPHAFLDPTPKFKSAAAASDTLPMVLPATVNLLAPFAPTSDQSWLTIAGVTNGVVSFSLATNNGYGRIAHITLLGQSISITQSGVPNSGVLGATNFVEGPAAGTDGVSLSSPLSPWTATANTSWLHLSAANQSGTNSATVVFTFDANPGPTRTGTLTIAGQTLTAIQAGATYVAANVTNVYVDPTPKFESAAAGSDVLPPVVPATQNLTGPFAPTSDQSWLTITGVTNGVVSFSFPTNNAKGRTGIITLLGQAVLITQAAISLGSTNRLEGPSAGTDTVVLASFSIPWTATNNASWLHLSAANQSGTGSTNVVFTFDANTGATRTGTLTIAGLPLTVTQAGSNYVPATMPVTALVSSGLSLPSGVAVDGTGNVYIADPYYNAIKEWVAASNTVITLASSGLNQPAGVALDGSGNVYIADLYNNAIKEWSATNHTVTTLVSSGLSGPFAVAVDGSGNVYIADTYNNAIKQWVTPSHAVITMASSGLSGPYGVAVDGAGNFYVGDLYNNAIQQCITGSHTVVPLVSSGLNEPIGVAVDGAGNVYFADSYNQAIKEWVAASRTVITLVSSGLNYPEGVAVDGAGNVYIADTYNSAIKELPRAFVDPTAKVESAAAGSDVLPMVLPVTENLLAPFAPTSDQPWLTITGATNGVVSFAFTANTGAVRTAHITLLGQSIAVTQAVIVQGVPMKLVNAQILANGTFQFAFTNVPGASFTILSTTNASLPLNLWTPLGAPVENPPGQYLFTGTPATNSRLFYMLRSP
jgi:DNA-binding beta-propeller fold protein YncE